MKLIQDLGSAMSKMGNYFRGRRVLDNSKDPYSAYSRRKTGTEVNQKYEKTMKAFKEVGKIY